MSTLSTTANNLYGLYVKATTDLAQSIVIKFEEVAKGMNKAVLFKTGQVPDETNPASWKYYQNICGQYHSSDRAMSIYSLDAETIIDFTIESLNQHPVTKAAYAFGGTYYNDLLAAYPDQEMLILGVLYPTNLSKALAAKDGTILSYPIHLIESGETDFLYNLQSWVSAYVHRWINRAYCVTDDLYAAISLAQLTLNLVGVISNLRLAACKTNQAHSFHVQQYLRSHGFLDTYMDQMTTKQILDMYRNINYYERNSGFEATFKQLVKVIMSDAGLPLYHYEMRHNQESLSHANSTDTTHLHSIAHFKRLPLNEIAERYPMPDVDLAQVHASIASTTPYNAAYQLNNYEDIANAFSLSKQGRAPTKLIECAINPIGALAALPPDVILFNQWIDWASSSRYAVPVEFIPEGSKTPIRLTHQQAVAIWVYVTHRALEPSNDPSYPKLTRVPSIQLTHVVRTPKPAIEELRSMIGTPALSEDMIQAIYATGVTIPESITSLVHFQQVCQTIYAANTAQFKLYSFQNHPQARGHAQGAATRFYEDKIVRLDDLVDPNNPALGMAYTTLIQQLGLNFSGYRPVDYFNTAIKILDSSTGSQNNDLLNPVNVQSAMASLLKYLSSYTIQIVTSGASDLRTVISQPDVRVSNYSGQETLGFKANIGMLEVLSTRAQESFHFTIPLDKIPSNRFNGLVPSFRPHIDVNLIPMNAYKASTTPAMRIQIGLTVASTFDPVPLLAALTMNQRNQIVDVY